MTTKIIFPDHSGEFSVERTSDDWFHVVLESLAGGSALAEVEVTESVLRHMGAAIATALESAPTKPKPERGYHFNTTELTELLQEEVGVENSGSWDPIADEHNFDGLTLKKFTMHDDRCTLKFTNGHKERIFHPEPEDPAKHYDGDLWDVSTLGW